MEKLNYKIKDVNRKIDLPPFTFGGGTKCFSVLRIGFCGWMRRLGVGGDFY